MKKIWLSQAMPSKNTYQQRKSMQNAYSELFRALFLLPDIQVQQRVLDAINGSIISSTLPSSQQSVEFVPGSLCEQCSLKQKASLAEASTQTDDLPQIADTCDVDRLGNAVLPKIRIISNLQSNSTSTSDDSRDGPSPAIQSNSTNATGGASLSTVNEETKKSEPGAPLRRKRKRKVCLPQVIKKSLVHHSQPYLLQHKPKKRKEASVSNGDQAAKPDSVPLANTKQDLSVQLQEEDYLNISFFTYLQSAEDVFDFPDLINLRPSNDHVLRTMAREFLESEIKVDGLLPIHVAITQNNLKILQRQIFVWKTMKKVDLNELLTDDDEDCLQLAISNNCSTEIVEFLLASGLNIGFSDEHSNTVIHLALLSDVDSTNPSLRSLELLMNRIDLSSLLQLNDDGYTPLHLAIRHDLYLQAEVMLNIIDERICGVHWYKREVSCSGKKDFKEFYDQACEELELRFAQRHISQHLKQRLLQTGEMRSGNTALFIAIENRMEHLIYLLLAHLADPRVQNHSGQDVRSYFSEFGKALNLTLKIDKAMERVINILK